MKPFIYFILMFCLTGSLAADTVVKSSAPFSFPLTVGVNWKQSFQAKNLSFVSKSSLTGRKVVELSWSLSSKTEKGNIFIFNLTGARVQTFAISSREGSVKWDVASGKKAGKGIYFAKLTCGTYQKSLKIIIN